MRILRRPFDPTRSALRAGLRAAVAVTLVFFVARRVVDDDLVVMATFAVFALLVSGDFSGRPGVRARSYLATAIGGAAVVGIGSAAADSLWAAVPVTLAVVYAVSTLAALGGAVTTARTPLLVGYLVSVALAGGPADAPERALAWLVGGLAATLASLVLWPRRDRIDVRTVGAAAARDLAGWIRSHLLALGDARQHDDPIDASGGDRLRDVIAEPTEVGVGGHDLLRAAGSLERARGLATRVGPLAIEEDRALAAAAADALGVAATTLEERPPHDASERLARAVDARDRHLDSVLARAAARPEDPAHAQATFDELASLWPLRVMGLECVEAAIHAARADRLPTPPARSDLVPGREPDPGPPGTWRRLRTSLASAVAPQGAWHRNSVRAAIGLTLAVLVVDLGDLQHAAWVLLGTLAVLHSDAAATGRTYLQALAGTAVGFAVAIAVVLAAGGWPDWMWVALPVAVFWTTYAPRAVYFAAGQAGFTVMVVLLFDLLVPGGWQTAVVRVESIAIGGAVGFGVSLLLWPRGAAAQLRADTARFHRYATAYLARALRAVVTRADEPGTTDAHTRALEERWGAETTYGQYRTDRRSGGPDPAAWLLVLSYGWHLCAAADFAALIARTRAAVAGCDHALAALARAADDVIAENLRIAEEIQDGTPLEIVPLVPPDAAKRREAIVACLRERSTDDARNIVGLVWTSEWIDHLQEHAGAIRPSLVGDGEVHAGRVRAARSPTRS